MRTEIISATFPFSFIKPKKKVYIFLSKIMKDALNFYTWYPSRISQQKPDIIYDILKKIYAPTWRLHLYIGERCKPFSYISGFHTLQNHNSSLHLTPRLGFEYHFPCVTISWIKWIVIKIICIFFNKTSFFLWFLSHLL